MFPTVFAEKILVGIVGGNESSVSPVTQYGECLGEHDGTLEGQGVAALWWGGGCGVVIGAAQWWVWWMRRCDWRGPVVGVTY